MRNWKTEIGKSGEEAAAAHLASLGYEILLRNYSCRFGELDIVARHEGILVFVEVKTRESEEAGVPEEAVTARKRNQIRRSALWFLQEKGLGEVDCRFDVVAVEPAPGGPPEIRVIPDAFDGFIER